MGNITFGPYTKALVALAAAALAGLGQAVGNGSLSDLSGNDWIKAIIVFLGTGAVTWFAENGAAAPIIKAVLGAAGAGLTAWTVAYENDVPAQGVVSQGEWLGIALAVVAALTVIYQLPNRGNVIT